MKRPIKRIGLMIDTLCGGGAERIVLNFHGVFTRMGHEAHIFLIKNEIEHDISHLPKDQLHILSEDGKLADSRVKNKRLLAQRLKDEVARIESDGKRFDFFTSNAEDFDRLSKMAGLSNVYIRYRNSLSMYILSKMGNKGPIKRYIRKWRFTRKFRSIYGDRDIITVSKALGKDMVETVGVRPRSITTIYNPFDFDRIRRMGEEPLDHSALPTPGLKPDEPYIVYAAKFENRKRQDVLIDAFAQANIPHKLVLIGGHYTDSDHRWYQQRLEQIQRLNLHDRVLLPGFQSNPYQWVKNARLFAMSSDSEGLPTVLIEALILGTPVVSTNCLTGPSEILEGAFSKFLSPVGEAQPLARNIEAAIASYPEITEATVARYRDSYAAERYLKHCSPNP